MVISLVSALDLGFNLPPQIKRGVPRFVRINFNAERFLPLLDFLDFALNFYAHTDALGKRSYTIIKDIKDWCAAGGGIMAVTSQNAKDWGEYLMEITKVIERLKGQNQQYRNAATANTLLVAMWKPAFDAIVSHSTAVGW